MTEDAPNEETHQPVMEEQEERDAPRREKSAEFRNKQMKEKKVHGH